MKSYLEERKWQGVRGQLRREAMYYRMAFWVAVLCITVYCYAEVFIGLTT